MSKRMLVAVVVLASLLIGAYQVLQGQDSPRPADNPPAQGQDAAKAKAVPQRMIIKVCNWDGVVPEPALNGFKMPAGYWYDFQKQGWQVESYLVAPNPGPAKDNGLYAVLKK